MIRKHKHTPSLLKRSASLVAVGALLFCGVMYPLEQASTPMTVQAVEDEDQQKVDQLKEEREKNKEEQQKKEEQLKDAEARKAEITAKLEEIKVKLEEKQAEYDKVEAEVLKLDAKIGDKDDKIDEKQAAIDVKEQEIEGEFQDLRQRLRAVSKTGVLSSTLNLIMNAENYSDYLVKNKAAECISEQNRQIMDELEAQLQEINDAKMKLEEEKAALEEELAPLEKKRAEMEVIRLEIEQDYSEQNKLNEELNQDIDTYKAAIAQHEKDDAELTAALNKAIAKANNSKVYNQSGTMLWPAPSCNIISSTFKWRWGRQHAGIDICGGGAYGTDIVAADDGVVSLAGWCGGYGYCVMIDHGINSNGRNVTTVYGHAARQPVVSVGQHVSRGDKIAVIGSTGNSTGPHLHFEVRVGGSAVDPIANGYVSTSGVVINQNL